MCIMWKGKYLNSSYSSTLHVHVWSWIINVMLIWIIKLPFRLVLLTLSVKSSIFNWIHPIARVNKRKKMRITAKLHFFQFLPMFFAFSARRSTLPLRLPASRDIPRRTRKSISRKKKQSERLGRRLIYIYIYSIRIK